MPELPEIAMSTLTALRSRETSFQEDHHALRIYGSTCGSGQLFDELQRLDELLRSADLGICFIKDMEALTINALSFEEIENRSFDFIIQKKGNEGEFFFFYLNGLVEALRDAEFPNRAQKVSLSLNFQPFATWSTWFLPWGREMPFDIPEWTGLQDPRKLVRDLTSRKAVPLDIRNWILCKADNLEESAVLNAWKEASSKRLMFVLPHEVVPLDDGVGVSFKGQRTFTLPVGSSPAEDLVGSFPVLHETAYWLYKSQNEADTKHALLNFHLAMESASMSNWPESGVLSRSLANAIEAYRLHLYDTGKEFPKSLADLRKALRDEVIRVNEATHSLVGKLWKDFAIAASVVAVRFATVTSGAISETGLQVLSCGTAFFLIVSLGITLYSNCTFFRVAEKSRTDWRNRLYLFMQNAEFTNLVDKPVQQGLRIYRSRAYNRITHPSTEAVILTEKEIPVDSRTAGLRSGLQPRLPLHEFLLLRCEHSTNSL